MYIFKRTTRFLKTSAAQSWIQTEPTLRYNPPPPDKGLFFPYLCCNPGFNIINALKSEY